MSLRKSPVRTPALLAANRRNAQISTGPRTARGKAWARLNRLKHGADSVEYFTFLKALMNAPPGKVLYVALGMLQSMPVVHPLYRETAELAIETERALCGFHVSPARETKKILPVRSRNVVENKQKWNYMSAENAEISGRSRDVTRKFAGIEPKFAIFRACRSAGGASNAGNMTLKFCGTPATRV